jgi:hypothetical protein
MDLFDPLIISGVRAIDIFSYLHHLGHWFIFSFYFLVRWFPSECVGNIIEEHLDQQHLILLIIPHTRVLHFNLIVLGVTHSFVCIQMS